MMPSIRGIMNIPVSFGLSIDLEDFEAAIALEGWWTVDGRDRENHFVIQNFHRGFRRNMGQ